MSEADQYGVRHLRRLAYIKVQADAWPACIAPRARLGAARPGRGGVMNLRHMAAWKGLLVARKGRAAFCPSRSVGAVQGYGERGPRATYHDRSG